ncbi:MAG: SDR family oxidoreductase [Pseudomonadales bacterium]|nr:SDR family oxidoreductase [Pseudomonadales bacterium]
MSEGRLAGKTVIVTGGAGILGHSVATVAKSEGAHVVLFDVVEDFSSDLTTNGAQYLQVDLTDDQAVAQAIAVVGSFDVVANIAGGFDMGPTVFETTDEQWDAMQIINVTTLRTVLRHAVPVLQQRGAGSIVNVGALGALRGAGNMGAYTAAKSTVMRLTEALSDELRHQSINVNAVLPSLIDTPRNRADMPDADHGQWVSPEDLANVICFLASDEASAVHGALIPVTGLV